MRFFNSVIPAKWKVEVWSLCYSSVMLLLEDQFTILVQAEMATIQLYSTTIQWIARACCNNFMINCQHCTLREMPELSTDEV